MIQKFTLVLEKVLLPLALVIFVYALGVTKIIEPDTFWHIKAGELIVKDLSIPSTDPFTFTLEGEPWADTEWLSQVIFYGIHALGGLTILTLFKAFIIATAYFTLYIHWRHSPIVSFPLFLCIALASRDLFHERPQVFTFLFLAIFVVIIERYREGKSNSLLALPLIVIPWANLHPGCLFGIALYGIILFSEAVKIGMHSVAGFSLGKAMSQQRFIKFSAFFFLTGLASFLNVNTYQIYSTLFSHLDIEAIGIGGISEFLPLSFSDSSTFFQLLLLMVLSGLIVVGIFINRKEADLSAILPVVSFMIPALWMRRFVAEFFIVSTPAFIWALRSLPMPQRFGGAVASLRPALLLLLFIIPAPLYLHLKHTDYYHFLGLGMHRQFFPKEAIEFIEKQGIAGNIFNSQNYGGALIYTTYPKRKVFFDTRYICYQRLLPRLTKAMQDAQRFDMLLSIYKVDVALVESEKEIRFLTRGLLPREKWALVYWDDLSEVFVRRLKKYSDIIQTNEYTMTNSETILGSQEIHSRDPQRRSSVKRELERALRVNPNVSKAWYALGTIQGNSERAISELNRALEVEPSFPEAHEALARIYHISGRPEAALSHYRDALTLSQAFGAKEPELASILNEMGALCLSTGKLELAEKYLKCALKMDPANPVVRNNLEIARSLRKK